MAHRDPHLPPDLGSHLSNLDPRTPNAKSRLWSVEAKGDGAAGERYKGTEQPEPLQGKITLIFAAEAPQGRLYSAKGRFFPAVSIIT